MDKNEGELHHECMQKFLDLANAMKEEGIDTRVVSAGLMTASAVYGTYAVAGNTGRLTPEGVDKLAGGYKEQVQRVQEAKKISKEKTA